MYQTHLSLNHVVPLLSNMRQEIKDIYRPFVFQLANHAVYNDVGARAAHPSAAVHHRWTSACVDGGCRPPDVLKNWEGKIWDAVIGPLREMKLVNNALQVRFLKSERELKTSFKNIQHCLEIG